jgi:hypothetical protein
VTMRADAAASAARKASVGPEPDTTPASAPASTRGRGRRRGPDAATAPPPGDRCGSQARGRGIPDRSACRTAGSACGRPRAGAMSGSALSRSSSPYTVGVDSPPS